jgi:hypothetical protein
MYFWQDLPVYTEKQTMLLAKLINNRNVLVEWVALPLRVCVVSASNLDTKTGYTD